MSVAVQAPTLADWAWPNRGPAAADKAAALARDHVLGLVGSALTSAGRQALLVKGAGISHLYPNGWLRPMADIDLLVRERDLEPVAAALVSNGFTREASDRPLTAQLLEIGMYAPAPHRALVELHTSMDKVVQRRIDLDSVFERAHASAQGSLLLPALEDQLLFVVQHLAADEFRHAAGIVDVEVLIAAGADLDLAAERAAEWRATAALYVALATLEGLLGRGTISPKILAKVQPKLGQRAFLSRHFDVGKWPVARRPTTLGLRWLYRQAALQDSLGSFIAGVAGYALSRARERIGMRISRR